MRWWWDGPGPSPSTASPWPPAPCARGACLIGTNEDPTHPTPHGLLPGSGALLAAVATAAEAIPEVAGKPHRPTSDAIRARATDLTLVVGDRPSTDGALARQLGVPFALVLSGVTGADGVPSDPAPDTVAVDLAGLVHAALDAAGPVVLAIS